MFDWNRLSRSGKDLAGVGRKLMVVSESELAKHNTEDDVWTAYRGTRMYSCTVTIQWNQPPLHFFKIHPRALL